MDKNEFEKNKNKFGKYGSYKSHFVGIMKEHLNLLTV